MTPVFCYFSPTPEIDSTDEWRLIQLWRSRWALAGFEPHVLNEYHASRHSFYDHYKTKVSKLPSINPGDYDFSCYMRWLAVAFALGDFENIGIMSDYDVIPYGFTEKILDERILIYGNNVPCLVQGIGRAFMDQCKTFADYKLREKDKCNGQVHISDMLIVEQQDEKAVKRLKTVKEYGEKGWERATAVHYANARMVPAGLTPRHQFIPQLR